MTTHEHQQARAWLTRWSPLPLRPLVATFTVHLPYGFSAIKLMAVTDAGPQFGPPGYEVNLLYLACLAALALAGRAPIGRASAFPLDAPG